MTSSSSRPWICSALATAAAVHCTPCCGTSGRLRTCTLVLATERRARNGRGRTRPHGRHAHRHGEIHAVAMRARSRTPAVFPTSMSRVVPTLARRAGVAPDQRAGRHSLVCRAGNRPSPALPHLASPARARGPPPSSAGGHWSLEYHTARLQPALIGSRRRRSIGGPECTQFESMPSVAPRSCS